MFCVNVCLLNEHALNRELKSLSFHCSYSSVNDCVERGRWPFLVMHCMFIHVLFTVCIWFGQFRSWWPLSGSPEVNGQEPLVGWSWWAIHLTWAWASALSPGRSWGPARRRRRTPRWWCGPWWSRCPCCSRSRSTPCSCTWCACRWTAGGGTMRKEEGLGFRDAKKRTNIYRYTPWVSPFGCKRIHLQFECRSKTVKYIVHT